MNLFSEIKATGILILFLVANVASGQTDSLKVKRSHKKVAHIDSVQAPVYYDDNVFLQNIKTVQLYDSSFQLSSPIIQLGTKQQLKLSFDDLEPGLKTFNYTLIHCSSDWQASDLSISDYSTGFQNDAITDYKYSLNTLQSYQHYNLVFPNENMNITKSGNYIIKVYQDNNPDKIVLTRRFMVYDEKVLINASIKPATTVSDRNYKQEVDFTISHTGYEIPDPYTDLKIVIYQNGRKDNAISKLKPQMVKDDLLIYDYDDENVFTGGNEFRNFDLKNLKFQTEHVQKITLDSLKNRAYLIPDEKRSFKRYSSNQDINGRYLVKMQEDWNSEREADYVYVHFFLAYDEWVTDGAFYIMGALSDWELKKECKLEFNPKRLGYEATLYLKQGYYNYEYVYLKTGDKIGDETVVEGMHFETENDYTIYVYHRAQGIYYDQLIGVKQLNTATAGRN